MNACDRSLPPDSVDFYRNAMHALDDAGVPFMVAGAFAFARYTGITRYTKDFDLFVLEDDFPAALDVLSRAGARTERNHSHWLGKAHRGEASIDLIYRTANGVAAADAEWFERAPVDEVLGVAAKICPPEELLWTKAFIMERERYDGADVAHLIHGYGTRMDWPHLLRRFGRHWRVLLSHLVLFQFIYPSASECIPTGAFEALVERLQDDEAPESSADICQGTLLSRTQYLVDVEEGGYRDARLPPYGDVQPDAVAEWTRAAEDE